MGSTRQLTCTLHLLAALAPLSAWRVPAKPKPADPFKKAPRKPPAVKMESGFDDDGEARGAGPDQGLTLVHFSAQLERFVWDRGCA
jgi:hypothetical protein